MADSPTTVPSASTRPTVPGAGSSGSSSRAPKIVVVASNPGSDATRTATISSCAHSFVESGHLPETTNPFNAPPAWKGATSTAPPDPVSMSPPIGDLRVPRHGCGSIPSACVRSPAAGKRTRASQVSGRGVLRVPRRSRPRGRSPPTGTQPNWRESTTPGARGLSERASKVAVRPAPRTSPTRLTSHRDGSVGSRNTRNWARRARPPRSARSPSPGCKRWPHRVLDDAESAQRPAAARDG